MLLKSLQELPASSERVVIINVGTKWVSTLALMSALKYADMPVLVIDCEYGDDSLAHFKRLMETHAFDLLSAPLNKHGVTLDWLFQNIPVEKVLLMDSDIEILDPQIIALAKNLINAEPEDCETVFGSGFTHGPSWLETHPKTGYYQERMWIPLTFLRTEHVREALKKGLSFVERTIYNDFSPSTLLSRILDARFRFAFSRTWTLSWLNPFKRSYYGQKPAYVFCDTGADIFQYLKYDRGMRFAGIPAELHRRFVTHFHGITRRTLNPDDLNSQQNGGFQQVRERLEKGYGILVGPPRAEDSVPA